ncbi:NAD(P)-binding protein [Lindgomyces ingoldianus]|uniref:NAD(P)-binding protein n=1 Tax=Lindgomyces ingoldianus TaxID=673940 RepID=A0ACB6QG36_9PLEO|nr:NAD(P)-binding protein [Lindgomyces ingoldianus]KAF2465096.1 NAD(P)-binding protein [Lindgomyces ingoldianus]
MADQTDPDYWTKQVLFTKSYHRDVYPAIDPKNPSNSAAGKIVLITGASEGLGKGIAFAFAAAGAAGVVITARRDKLLQTTAQTIREKSPKTEVVAVACDVTDEEATKSLFESIKQKFGKLDIVVANAGGVSQGKSAFPKIGDFETRAWWNDFEINVRGTHLTSHHYITTFGPQGTIIGLTSGAASISIPGMSSYIIAKLAIIRIMELLHVEYPDLRTFSFNPGIVNTPQIMDAFAPYAHDTPELGGAMCCWLATGRAEFMRGRYVGVNFDVEVLEKHKEEIVEKNLLKTKFLNVDLGLEGYALLE